MEEAPELAANEKEYSALQPLAVVALVLGLASVLAFVGPLLLVIPAAAVAASLRAMASINDSGGNRTGAGLARVGAALAIFCAVASGARIVVGNSILHRQACDVAQQWLSLVHQEKYDAALDLLAPRKMNSWLPRQAPGSAPLSNKEVRRISVEGLREDPAIQELVALQGNPTLKPISSPATPSAQGKVSFLGGDFLIEGLQSAEPKTLRLVFGRAAAFEASGIAWRIDSWQLLENADQ